MGIVNKGIYTPPDKNLTIEGVAADAKAVGDALENATSKTEIIDDWRCITLDCGIKIATFHGRYGSTAITGAEGSLFWASFSKKMPSEFFSVYPAVFTQCEVESGYALHLVLDPKTSDKDKVYGWFYTNKSYTCNPYIHIFCIGV